jgi:molybdate transport system permease protein
VTGRIPPRRRRQLDPTPLPLRLLAATAVLFVAVPFAGLAARVPWDTFIALLGRPALHAALLLSLESAAAATVVSMLTGVPLAWTLSRRSSPVSKTVRSLVTVPMVLPPVVAGAMMLFALGLNGWLGAQLATAGLTLPYTTTGVIVVQTFVALPQVVVTAEAAFRALDSRYEQAAATCGAAPWTVFWRIVLPLTRPGLLAAALLAWAKALGEFGATITFAGNLPGRTQTMPLAISLALENEPGAAVVMSVILVVISIAVLLAVNTTTRSNA